MKYLLFALLLICENSFAQIQRSPAKQSSADTAKITAIPSTETENRKELFRELDLSREQKIKIREISQLMKSSKEGILNDGSLTDAQKKERLKNLRKEQLAKIESILTEEQKIKFRERKSQTRREGQ